MCHSFITRHYDRLQQADETVRIDWHVTIFIISETMLQGSVMAKLKPVIDELQRTEEIYRDAAIQAI